MNKKKVITILLIAVPLMVGSYFIYKSFKSTNLPPSNQKLPDPNAGIKTNGKIDKSKLSSNGFPLKYGSGTKANPDSNVKALQDILGITIDGIFRDETLAALQEQTGKSQVDSLDDLNAIIDQVMAQDSAPDVVSSNITKSQQIINDFHNNLGAKSLKAIRNTKLTGYSLDSASNQYQTNEFIINWDANKVYSASDYEPYDYRTDNGFLIINCNKGANQGIWLADPNDITLV